MKIECAEQAVATRNNEKYFVKVMDVKWEKKYISQA